VSAAADEGWTAPGFDDADWFLTDASFINTAAAFWLDPAGPQLPTAYTVSPGELHFRKVFTLTAGDKASEEAVSAEE
jgi:hypothetical protein